MEIFSSVYEYHKQNQPIPVTIQTGLHVEGTTCEPGKVIGYIVDKGKYILYNTYSTCTKLISDRLDMYKEPTFVANLDPHKMASHARIIKQSSKIAIQCYRDMVLKLDEENQKILISIPRDEEVDKVYHLGVGYLLTVVPEVLRELRKSLFHRYTTSDGFTFGIINGVDVHLGDCKCCFACELVNYLIPNTSITLFEFLFMDMNLTHLSILNYEELMVEKFKNIELIIRDRCKTLNKIYDTHLIFNEKRSNFPEDCTNHILKFCPPKVP